MEALSNEQITERALEIIKSMHGTSIRQALNILREAKYLILQLNVVDAESDKVKNHVYKDEAPTVKLPGINIKSIRDAEGIFL